MSFCKSIILEETNTTLKFISLKPFTWMLYKCAYSLFIEYDIASNNSLGRYYTKHYIYVAKQV